jgi:hypothetical protein
MRFIPVRCLNEQGVSRQSVLTATLLATFVTSSVAAAADFGHELLHGVCVPDCVRKRCCDDYHAKPLTPVRCLNACCCDDYCSKPLPCPARVKRFCCDDYCPKKSPCIICPPCSKLKCPATMPHFGQRVSGPMLPGSVAEQVGPGPIMQPQLPHQSLDR